MNKQSGRPKKPIDLAQFEKLVQMGCTQGEIASFFDMEKNTLEKRLIREPELKRIWAQGADKSRISLRRMQWQAAMKGNAAMLIWLGKLMLKQKDPTFLEHSGPDGLPIPISHVQMSQAEIERISKKLDEMY